MCTSITSTEFSARDAVWTRFATHFAGCASGIHTAGSFVVLDNLHLVQDHPRFLAILKKLHIHPVFTTTQSSWHNLIEAQFGVLKKFTVANTDDTSYEQRHQRVAA